MVSEIFLSTMTIISISLSSCSSSYSLFFYLNFFSLLPCLPIFLTFLISVPIYLTFPLSFFIPLSNTPPLLSPYTLPYLPPFPFPQLRNTTQSYLCSRNSSDAFPCVWGLLNFMVLRDAGVALACGGASCRCRREVEAEEERGWYERKGAAKERTGEECRGEETGERGK